MKAGFDPLTLASELERLGLRLEAVEMDARYFHGHADLYHAAKHFHYAKAVVA